MTCYVLSIEHRHGSWIAGAAKTMEGIHKLLLRELQYHWDEHMPGDLDPDDVLGSWKEYSRVSGEQCRIVITVLVE